jgi:hypothetical protein
MRPPSTTLERRAEHAIVDARDIVVVKLRASIAAAEKIGARLRDDYGPRSTTWERARRAFPA